MRKTFAGGSAKKRGLGPVGVVPVLAAVLLVGSGSSCWYLGNSDRGPNSVVNGARNGNATANAARPVPEGTLAGSEAVTPPVELVEALRGGMREAAPAAARERHPASEVVGEGCVDISFALLESRGDLAQYIGIYRCTMKGTIVGVSKFDSQVQVIGEIGRENGAYIKKIVSSGATN
jgi:hypothetical protein